MLTVYWVCFALGGTFVLLAVLSGIDGVDFGDHDFGDHGFGDHDIDGSLNLDEDVEVSGSPERSPSAPFQQRRDPWYGIFAVFKTLKFWTFALCFFGLTGLVLSHLSVPLPAALITSLAIGMGLVCGGFVSGSLRWLQRRHTDSLVRTNDLVGLSGTVVLPLDQTQSGKVQVSVKGSLLEMIARTDDVNRLQVGDRVLVVGTEHNRLWVVRAESSASDAN